VPIYPVDGNSASRGVGIAMAAKQTGYRAAKRCPVCGSPASGSAGTFGHGAVPVMRAFYACGYTVTAAEKPSGRMLVVGVGCRTQRGSGNKDQAAR